MSASTPLPHRKPTLGLTGGIASGKSTVASILRGVGVGVVDADQVAREVVLPGTEGLQEVVAAFGRDVLHDDGSLNRDALAQRVFGDEPARLRLQAILHPRIGKRSAELLAALRDGPGPYVVYEAPLLVEVGGHKALDGLIVVASGQEAQLERASARDAASRAAIAARIAAQLPLERKLAEADYVIWNDATLSELERRTLEVHRQIVERAIRTHTGES